MKNALQGGSRVGQKLRDWRRIFAQNRRHGFLRSRLAKSSRAGEHFVENGAKGKDVRAMVDGLSAHLLRGHVADGAHDHAGLGAAGHGCPGVLGLFRTLRQLRQAEIENLDAAIAGDEEIFRLEVAMDDGLFVCGCESTGDLHALVDGFPNRQGTGPQQLTQRAAFEQFRDQVGGAVEGAELIDREDVGMVESRSRPRLLLKTPQSLGIRRGERGQDFDGDVPL